MFALCFKKYLSKRCFVDGCDDSISPQYLAEWMDATVIRDLHINAKEWQCEFPKFAILSDCANITTNDVCDGWIFDKSIFSSTIVTDVPNKLVIFFLFLSLISNFSLCLVSSSLQRFVETHVCFFSYHGRHYGRCLFPRSFTRHVGIYIKFNRILE